jgi:prophage regulatory protein
MKPIRFAELKARKGIPWSRVHVTRLEKAGQFPRRIHIGANTVVWDEDEIDALLNARAAARDQRSA